MKTTTRIGSWIQIGHPAIAEIMANAGFDWLAVDTEHTDISMSQTTNLIRAMEPCLPFVRVRENDTLCIRQALDAGAEGVIVPLVNTADDARRAVAAAKYPPAGVRGHAFCRANNYGAGFDTYAANANNDTAVIVMIESKEAVDNISDILAVVGVDGAFIGPYDLSGSYGIPGETSHPLILDARDRVLEACKTAGKAAGIHVVIPRTEDIAKAKADGFTFIAIGGDTMFLNQAAREAAV